MTDKESRQVKEPLRQSSLANCATVFSLIAIMAVPVLADRLTVVTGSEARKENFQVAKRINWHQDLDQARAEAAKSGKLVFWMHMLGSVDGKT